MSEPTREERAQPAPESPRLSLTADELCVILYFCKGDERNIRGLFRFLAELPHEEVSAQIGVCSAALKVVDNERKSDA